MSCSKLRRLATLSEFRYIENCPCCGGIVYLSWDVATLYLSLQDFFKTRPSSAPPNPTILQDIGLPRPAFQNKDTFADYISLIACRNR